MSNDFKGLATLTVDLLGTSPSDLLYIAQHLAKLAQDKQAVIEEAVKRAQIDAEATKKADQIVRERANGASVPQLDVPEVPNQSETVQ